MDKITDAKSKLSCIPLPQPGRKKTWILVGAGAILVAIAIGLGVGLGVGLNQGQGDGSSASPSPSTPTNNTSNGTYWKPSAGETWQIVLNSALDSTAASSLENVSVYDIDLFTNPATTIASLHSQDRKVICYFSAGSYEDFRPDSNRFVKSDYGKGLQGWKGEWWLDTNSQNVREIMTDRLKLAQQKGCDGVDPDNVDGFDNDTGLSLTTADAVDYLTFLADAAHGLNMSIGLKNAGTIVDQTLGIMEWEVNEQCVQYNECDTFQVFIESGKPVFHIEYPSSAPSVSAATKVKACGDDGEGTKGFSTLLKEMDLSTWVEFC